MPSCSSLLARHQLVPMAAMPPGTMITVSTPFARFPFTLKPVAEPPKVGAFSTAA
ncbi:hypothetical protein [Reyranella soli]|uniref:hypothetical protein n=1 Tax=Reyranella soli TaxID=1230389 RepID=UPI001478FBD0|nr:hypothetical protein [Reyranella soli]